MPEPPFFMGVRRAGHRACAWICPLFKFRSRPDPPDHHPAPDPLKYLSGQTEGTEFIAGGECVFPKFPCHRFHKEGADSLLLRQKQPQLLPMHRRKIRPLSPMKRKKSAVNEPIFVYCRCFYASFVPLFFRSRITRTTISAANPTPVPTQPLR